MVSTHQKYLCPDYLNPLTSAALDSNKSPLALLAQTCNSIGLPETSTTTNGNGKSSKSADATPTKQDKSSTSSNNNKEDTAKSSNKTSSSQADSTSDAGESSTSLGAIGKGKESPSGKRSADAHKTVSVATAAEDTVGASSSGASEATPSTSSVDVKSTIPNGGNLASMVPSSATLAAKCGTCVTPAAYPPHLFSHYFAAAQPATAAAAPAFLYGHGLAGIPLSCYPGGFVGATPMPTMATAGAGFPRFCTDPFCKSCPPNPAAAMMTPMNLAAGPTAARQCPLGCTQCTSHPLDLSLWLNSYSSMLQNPTGFHAGLMPSMASPNSAALAAAAAAAANNPFLGHYPIVSSAASGPAAIPPVCWWNSGDGYCLKRFSNAEELLQHLRTHAHESASKNSLMNQPLAGQLAAHSAAAAAAAAGRLSPRSSNYLNSLNSLRYHPYNKLSPTANGSGMPTSMANMPFPTLNPTAYGLPSSLYSVPTRLPGSLPHP